MERNPARRALITLLLAAAALALLIAPATARPKAAHPAPLTPGATYLALGDSVTFGYLESNVTPAPDYNHASNFLGYPEHLARELHINVVNASCPGETAASLINAAAASNGCENDYRKLHPLHVAYKGSQLDFAVRYLKTHRKVRLVSLMIGANDVFLCQARTPDGCKSPKEFGPVFASITKNVHAILAAIRNKAHYTGQIVIVNYYSLDYSSAFYTAFSGLLNGAQDAGAKGMHVKFADGFGIFKAHARLYGGSTCTAALITHLTTGTCGVHPTFAGQSLLAEAVLRVLRWS